MCNLIQQYRAIGFEGVALGGLLKQDSTMPCGLKFGLDNEEFSQLLSLTKPDFVLGGLALSRLEVLRKHQVAADSTQWIWWQEVYDRQRFSNRDALKEVLSSEVLDESKNNCGRAHYQRSGSGYS